MLSDSQRSSDTALLPSAVLYCAASFLHFAHNGLYLREYPNLPGWLSSTAVYLAWLAVTAVGAIGYLLYAEGVDGLPFGCL